MAKKTLSAEEVRKRIDNARIHINLGSGSLLSPAGKFSDEETEQSLQRLLKKIAK